MKTTSRHMATLLISSRKKLGLTQYDTNKVITKGLARNGQFWSSIERGKCGLPLKHFPAVAVRLNIPIDALKEAHEMDHRESLDSEMAMIVGAL